MTIQPCVFVTQVNSMFSVPANAGRIGALLMNRLCTGTGLSVFCPSCPNSRNIRYCRFFRMFLSYRLRGLGGTLVRRARVRRIHDSPIKTGSTVDVTPCEL
jgi:hypothetical protein